jgi:hypothetical protein
LWPSFFSPSPNFLVGDDQTDKMKRRLRDYYFICFLTTGLILISLHHFNNSNADNTISICKTISAQSDATKRHQDCIADYDEVDQELMATYPWIDDPSCRHFAVQVKIIS